MARKPSSDPNQEKLRAAKESWNKSVSTLIGELIDFKRAMNGHPSRFSNNQRSRITEPFSFDPNTIIGVLASDFQEIAQKGTAIVEEQANYAKTRRRSKPKSFTPQTTNLDQNWESKPDLTQQLSASVENFLLVAEGSNPITRTFSRLKGPWFFGEKDLKRKRKFRISLLDVAARIEDELKKFEATIMGSSAESIFAASKLLDQIQRDLSFFSSSLDAFKSGGQKSLPAKSEENVDGPKKEVNVEEKTEAPKPEDNLEKLKKNTRSKKGTTEEEKKFIQSVAKKIKDFRANFLNFDDVDEDLKNEMGTAVQEVNEADEFRQKTDIAMYQRVNDAYEKFLADLNARNGGTNFKRMIDVLADIQRKEKEGLKNASMSEMEITAQNILNKWVGKAVHNLNPFDKTSPLRLDVVRSSEKIRKLVDQMLELLESDLDPIALDPIVKEVGENFVELKSLMRPLEKTIQNRMFDQKFLKMLEDNQLPDFGTNLDKKQRERLLRNLEQRKFRDLGRFYDEPGWK